MHRASCICFTIEIFPHKTIVETKEERISRGHPTGHDVPYAAMGGITGFSSLMDGYMRLDDSGIGPPPLHMLEQPVGMQKKKKIARVCCLPRLRTCSQKPQKKTLNSSTRALL